MKTTPIAFIAAAFGALAGYSAMNSDIALMLLGLLGVLGTLVWYGLAGAKHRRTGDPLEGLAPESRALLRPLRRLQGEVATLVSSNNGSSAMFIGREALQESNHLVERCAEMLKTREELSRISQGRGIAESETRDLTERLERAGSDDERSALEAALAARKKEQEHYALLSGRIAEIDGVVHRAEAALSEIKARLAVATSSSAAGVEDIALTESLGKLKALSVSFDEAADMLEERR